jgi:hypothetical protein
MRRITPRRGLERASFRQPCTRLGSLLYCPLRISKMVAGGSDLSGPVSKIEALTAK